MDVKVLLDRISGFFKKYRYAALILVIGLVLMAVPGRNKGAEEKKPSVSTEAPVELTVEQKLASVLSQTRGAGNVQVMLTVAAGEETLYQTNDDTTSSSDSTSTNIDTVTITDADRNQTGLIRQVNPPVYQGAIVVCQGADDPAVKLAIVDAVSKLTGLGANRISVLKMK